MERKITCFIPYTEKDALECTIASLKRSEIVEQIILAAENDITKEFTDPVISTITTSGFASSESVKMMDKVNRSDYMLVYTKPFPLDAGKPALKRMVQVCESTGAGMVYSDYLEKKQNKFASHPLIDYQEGSLRDDFNFGSVVLYSASAVAEACLEMDAEYKYAGLYDLRLRISRRYAIIHIPEPLYTEIETDLRKSGEKQFDYVDPRNRAVQIEMEKACIDHLKKIKAWLKPEFREVNFIDSEFGNDVSVIIPVKNRAKTISDAIKSVLKQKSDYKFNLIVIDNYSTDGTTDIIKSFARNDNRIIHLIPERKDLGIGGCWNEGIFHKECGKFAIQLDSDDLYIDENVINTVVRAFYDQKCAMVVGSYKMVDFKLNEIPPGVISHREWTPDDGRNNALRINGLGAPRAFYTPVLRAVGIPNVSYGEDYAVGLAISRFYRIGRIYDPVYLCRRWEENTDAALDINKLNMNNLYKDRIRSIELMARKQLIGNN
jgi:hypothetical protein